MHQNFTLYYSLIHSLYILTLSQLNHSLSNIGTEWYNIGWARYDQITFNLCNCGAHINGGIHVKKLVTGGIVQMDGDKNSNLRWK